MNIFGTIEMDKKLARLGLMMAAITTLCSCNNTNNDDEWKYPKALYVEYFEWGGYGKTIKNVKTFSNDEHSKASYRYDGNTLFVRESKENSNTNLVDGHYQTEYLGTWSEESTYEYVRCQFWVIV